MSKTPWLIRLVRPTYGKWLNWHYDVSLKGFEHLPTKGPFLIIGNHVHTYDPLFLSSAVSFHIHWVMGAYLFKTKILNYLFNTLIRGISKQQGKSDLHTIKGMKEKLDNGDIVGFFPEGTRTWDGESVRVDNATAKLIRLFHVPVVVIHFEGAFGSRPRWAAKKRKGPVTLRVVKVIQKEELKNKSIDEVVSLVNDSLEHSYNEWQKEHRVPYLSDTKAEGIENVLYACPECRSFSTIKGSLNHILCRACKSEWEINEYDEIISYNKPTNYPTIASWHTWERGYLEEILQKDSPRYLFPFDDGVLFQHAPPHQLILLSNDFSFSATMRAFVLHVTSFKMIETPFKGDKIIFNFDDITSIVINAKSTLEFSHKKEIYRVRIKPNQSILKYLELYQTHQQLTMKESV